MTELSKYNPSIQALLELCKTDWGNPLETRKLLVSYGIKPFDTSLYGIDVINGELNLVMAPEKKRKTTFMVNIIANIMLAPMPEEKPLIVVDTLESGMPPNRYRDTLIANVATRKLLQDGHKPSSRCPICESSPCKEIGLSPEFLRFNARSQPQQKAIDWAISVMMDWNLYIYGANPHQGNTRDLKVAVKRWEMLKQEVGMKILVVDHVQQFSFGGFGELSDYEKQLRTVSACADVVARNNVVIFALSQVSLGSQKSAREGTGKWVAKGGSQLASEANTIFTTDYENGSGSITISIADSRKSNTYSIVMPIEDVSGVMYGNPEKRHY